MTYLQLVNAVLRRLREDEVASVSETVYSTMIGDFVNDAKKMAEAAWDWTALRQTLTVTTAQSTNSYALTGAGTDFKALNVLNDTSDAVMRYKPASYFDSSQLTSTSEGVPLEFTYRGTDANGDTQLEVLPIPDGVYSILFKAVVRQADLTDDTDILTIPSQPVMYSALALATRERGEQGGMSAAEYAALADNYLSDAVALDASRYDDELTWCAV